MIEAGGGISTDQGIRTTGRATAYVSCRARARCCRTSTWAMTPPLRSTSHAPSLAATRPSIRAARTRAAPAATPRAHPARRRRPVPLRERRRARGRARREKRNLFSPTPHSSRDFSSLNGFESSGPSTASSVQTFTSVANRTSKAFCTLRCVDNILRFLSYVYSKKQPFKKHILRNKESKRRKERGRLLRLSLSLSLPQNFHTGKWCLHLSSHLLSFFLSLY